MLRKAITRVASKAPVVARAFSAAAVGTPEIDASKLVVTRTSAPKAKTAFEKLKFGHTFSDHMLEVDWNVNSGWSAPVIRPHGPLSIDPAASSLHYALQGFEGMKAYIDAAGEIRLFRPDMNMKRINTTAKRMLLPHIEEEQALLCLKELLRVDKDWIPNKRGYSLYLRPTIISTTPFLGVAPPTDAKFYVICSPVGPYYPTGFAPVKLLADPQYVRAWPGGTGNVKCGGNYAMSIGPAREAAAKGYSQLLWLFGEDHQVTEVGTMNQFWYWKSPVDGAKELVTAPLDGTILPGVTRDSIIRLAKGWGIRVREEHYTIADVINAVKEGRMIEAFGAGTAAIVSPVSAVGFDGVDYEIPLSANKEQQAGDLTKKIADTLLDIQYGDTPHEWSVVVN